jgi:hypothetical protein
VINILFTESPEIRDASVYLPISRIECVAAIITALNDESLEIFT